MKLVIHDYAIGRVRAIDFRGVKMPVLRRRARVEPTRDSKYAVEITNVRTGYGDAISPDEKRAAAIAYLERYGSISLNGRRIGADDLRRDPALAERVFKESMLPASDPRRWVAGQPRRDDDRTLNVVSRYLDFEIRQGIGDIFQIVSGTDAEGRGRVVATARSLERAKDMIGNIRSNRRSRDADTERRIEIVKGNRAVIASRNDINSQWTANLYVNTRGGIQNGDITTTRGVFKTEAGVRAWAASVMDETFHDAIQVKPRRKTLAFMDCANCGGECRGHMHDDAELEAVEDPGANDPFYSRMDRMNPRRSGAGGTLDDDIHNRPLAASGLTSYRIKGPYGYIMIGARSTQEAMREAARSTRAPRREDLEVWGGDRYVPAHDRSVLPRG